MSRWGQWILILLALTGIVAGCNTATSPRSEETALPPTTTLQRSEFIDVDSL